jgi:hypothetical protein
MLVIEHNGKLPERQHPDLKDNMVPEKKSIKLIS